MKITEVMEKQRPSIEEVIQKFKTEEVEDIEYGNIRDNCGFVAASFSKFAEKFGLDVPRIHGRFELDGPEFDVKNFKSSELQEMEELGYNSYDVEDRECYAEQHDLLDELTNVNHYWNSYNGKIIDFSGQAQFIESGLASDLNSWRYKVN